MILYHGSSKRLWSLKNRQAESKAESSVPDGDLFRGIYLTPIFEVAIAMAARPNGVTQMEKVGDQRTIAFEKPESFNPNKKVFVYVVGSAKIPADNLKKINDEQYVIVGIDKIKPDSVEKRKSSDIFRYFQLVDFKQ